MSQERTLIRNATVVTMDDDLGDLDRADILVEGAKIAAVAPDLGVEDAEVIDADGFIVVPGFVNTHLHTWQHALRGVCADWTVKGYVRCWRVHLGPMYRPEDMRAGNYVGALDALNAGVTLIVDYCHNVVTPDHAHGALDGLRAAGGRALFGLGYTPVLSHGFAELPETDNLAFPDHASRVAFAHRLAGDRFSSKDELVTLAIVPQEIEIAEWDDVVAEFQSARELDARITIHANQVLAHERWHDIDRLQRAGLLADDTIFVHCTFSSDEEFRLLGEAGASVSVAVETEMQMGMGQPATGRCLEHGVTPSLGVDITSNSSGDMFAQMRLALQVGRMLGDERFYRETSMPEDVTYTTRDALAWATINGARAAGLDHKVGSITPGKEADLVLIDANAFNLLGWNRSEPTGAVVLHAHPGNVDTVLVGGRIVKRGGELVHVDVAAARRELEASHAYVDDWAQEHGGLIPQPPIALSF
jgi:cytosine/adenosine deaminase-related metal-dependent hydrolase